MFFADERDLEFYAKCLMDYSVKFTVNIHPWVFMKNHVNLLVTPKA